MSPLAAQARRASRLIRNSWGRGSNDNAALWKENSQSATPHDGQTCTAPSLSIRCPPVWSGLSAASEAAPFRNTICEALPEEVPFLLMIACCPIKPVSCPRLCRLARRAPQRLSKMPCVFGAVVCSGPKFLPCVPKREACRVPDARASHAPSLLSILLPNAFKLRDDVLWLRDCRQQTT